MRDLMTEVRLAVRSLLRAPAFALTAIFTLALGVGATTAVIAVVNGVVLRPLPYHEPDRLAMIWSLYPQGETFAASLPDFLDWRSRGRSFDDMAAYTSGSANLSADDAAPAHVTRTAVTANFFSLLGVPPALGRGFSTGEDHGGGAKVAVLSHGLWNQRFGGDSSIVGRTIRLHGDAYEVIGVAPASFRFIEASDVWTPVDLDAQANRRGEFLNVVARLRDAVSMDAARAAIEAVGEQLREEFPGTNANVRVTAQPLEDYVIGDVRTGLYSLLAAVGLVLLIAVSNVGSLVLTRSAARQRELAIRASLGAGRGRIARQLLTESLCISLTGAAGGAVLATWAISAMRAARADIIPRFAEVSVDATALGATALLAVVTAALFALLPVIQAGRAELASDLRAGGRGVTGERRARRIRSTFVVGQVALALMLLVGAGLLLRSFDRVQSVSPGLDPDGLLAARVALPTDAYADAGRRRQFFADLRSDLATSPGVSAVAVASNIPLRGGAGYLGFAVEGIAAPQGVVVDAQPFVVSENYFATVRTPVLEGRAFEPGDDAEATPVVVVSREMVRRHWDGRSPVGTRITFGDPTDPASVWRTVIGVVEDTRVTALTDGPYPQVYLPAAQSPQPAMFVLARATDGVTTDALALRVREAVRRLDPALPAYDIATMNERFRTLTAQPRVSAVLLASFAGVAALLAVIGVYGLLAYSVAHRTSEMGVRLALGAQPSDVSRLVVSQGMAPVLAGIVLGVLGAWAGATAVQSLLFETSATDPVVFAGVTALLGGAALLACYLPARRAGSVDPMVAVRND